MPTRFIILLILAITMTFVVVALPIIPLGIASKQPDGTSVVEWIWSRHSSVTDLIDLIDRILWPSFAAICLVFVARSGFRRIHNGGKKSNAIIYGLLLIASTQWILAVQQSASSPHRELKPLWVLYDPAASGYFYEAAFDIEDTNEFLKTYEARMAEGDVLHVGTHPPGMFLLAKACIEVCRRVPATQSLADALTPIATVEAFRYVEQNAALQRSLTPTELGGLKLLSLATLAMAIFTMIPLGLLANRMFAPTTAWMLCCLWPTVPAISVFFPKSDVIFPSLSLLLLFLAAVGSQSVKQALIFGVVGGIILLAASCFSLAILPTVAAIGVFLTLQIFKDAKRHTKSACTLIGSVTATFAIAMVAINSIFDCNLWGVFQQNLANHEGFYQQFQRTYWKWLLVNPIEFGFAIGLPIMGLAVASMASLFKKHELHPANTDKPAKVGPAGSFSGTTHSMLIALVTTMVLLWISGKNNGEAARLWCFMTPWVLLLSATSLQHLLEPLPNNQTVKAFTWLLAAQLLLCLMTVSRVSGFSF